MTHIPLLVICTGSLEATTAVLVFWCGRGEGVKKKSPKDGREGAKNIDSQGQLCNYY